MKQVLLFHFLALFSYFLISPFHLVAQESFKVCDADIMHHHISVNPLNILLFQQIGATYEYRLGRIGFGITPGYIYPNKKEYSNYFIAGPTNLGSLGWYTGWFVVPQVNLYLSRPHYDGEGSQWYFALKFVYKNMRIDTNTVTVWTNQGDGYNTRRKMDDRVNIYGFFMDGGYRYFLGHFFFDLNFGLGPMWVNHEQVIYGEASGGSYIHIQYINPPREESYHQKTITINFALNLGFAF